MKSCCVYWLFDAGCSFPEKDGYVGITDNLQRRLRAHRKRFSSFTVKVIFSGTRDECAALEFNLRPDHEIGWNTAQGGKQTRGHLGLRHSAAAREKMRLKKLGYKHTTEARSRMGRPMSDETKEKLRIINTGSKRTPEQRARMSAAQIGNTKKRGWKAPTETREKIRVKATGRKASEEARKRMSESARNRHSQTGG